METICDENLHIPQFIFGAPGSLNDLNVLYILPAFSDVCAGVWPSTCPFSINSWHRNMPYYLVDGIHPKYPIFVAPYPIPVTSEEQAINRLQQAVSEDVERLYSVMTSRFHVALRPARAFHMANIAPAARAVESMHDMITVLRRNGYVSRRRTSHYSHQSDDTPADLGGPLGVAPASNFDDEGEPSGCTGEGDGGGVHSNSGGRVRGLGTDSAP